MDADLEAKLGAQYGALFTRQSVLEKLIANKAFPFADVVAKQLQYTIPRPMIPQWDAFTDTGLMRCRRRCLARKHQNKH